MWAVSGALLSSVCLVHAQAAADSKASEEVVLLEGKIAAIAEKSGEMDAALVKPLLSLGRVLMNEEQYVKSSEAIVRGAQILRKTGDVDRAEKILEDATKQLNTRDDKQGLELVTRELLDLTMESRGTGDMKVINSMGLLGSVLFDQGKLEESEEWYSQQLTALRKIFGEEGEPKGGTERKKPVGRARSKREKF